MTVGQLIIFDFHGQTLKVIVKSLSVLELAEQQGGGRGHWEGLDPRNFGVMMDKTDITMMKGAEANGLNIKASAKK
jgi:vesicle-fusing ATPase